MAGVRVLQVIARMNVGGPAVQVAELVRGLDPSRYDISLVTGWCADDEADYLMTQEPDLPVTRIDGLGRSVRAGADLQALGRLVAQVRAFRPHIVHTHTAKAGVLGRAAVRLAGTGSATVHTFHGHLLHGYFDARTTRAVVAAESALARGTDLLVTVGERVRDDLLAAGVGSASQYAVIAPGIASPAALARTDAREARDIDDGTFVVAVVGRLTGIKRPDRVLDVTERLVAAGLPLQVLVAGGGDLARWMQEEARERRLPVRMLGWYDRPGDVLAAADLALLASDNEGTPVAIVQAALLRVPAVASDVGSVREVVLDDMTGLLALPQAGALAAAVLQLAGDAPRRRSLGDAAQRHALAAFGVDRYLAEHAGAYERIVRARRASA